MFKNINIIIFLLILIIGSAGYLYFYNPSSEEDIQKNVDNDEKINNDQHLSIGEKISRKKDDYISFFDFWLVHLIIILIVVGFSIFIFLRSIAEQSKTTRNFFYDKYNLICTSIRFQYYPEKVPKNATIIKKENFDDFFKNIRKNFEKEICILRAFLDPDMTVRIWIVLCQSIQLFISVFIEIISCVFTLSCIAFFCNKTLYSFRYVLTRFFRKILQGKTFLPIFFFLFISFLIFQIFFNKPICCNPVEEEIEKNENADPETLFFASFIILDDKEAYESFKLFLRLINHEIFEKGKEEEINLIQ